MDKDKDMAPDSGGTEADKALAMRYAFGSGADPDRELVEEVCRKLDASGEEDAAAVASYCRWYIADLDGRYGDSMKHAADYISSPEAEEGIKVQLLDYLMEKNKRLAGMDERERSRYLKIKEPPKSEPPVRGKKPAVMKTVIIGIVILAVIAAGLIVGLRACGGGEDSPSGAGNEENMEYSAEHDEAMEAYKEMMSSGYIEVDGVPSIYEEQVYDTENCRFAVAYIDDDDIPELVVYDREDDLSIGDGVLFIYSDGKVEQKTRLAMNIDDEYLDTEYYFGDLNAGYFKGSGYLMDISIATDCIYTSVASMDNMANGYSDTYIWAIYKFQAPIDDPRSISGISYCTSDPEQEESEEYSREEFYEDLDEMTGGAEFVPYDLYKNTPENRDKILR